MKKVKSKDILECEDMDIVSYIGLIFVGISGLLILLFFYVSKKNELRPVCLGSSIFCFILGTFLYYTGVTCVFKKFHHIKWI